MPDINSITITNPGNGYSSSPSATISGGGYKTPVGVIKKNVYPPIIYCEHYEEIYFHLVYDHLATEANKDSLPYKMRLIISNWETLMDWCISNNDNYTWSWEHIGVKHPNEYELSFSTQDACIQASLCLS